MAYAKSPLSDQDALLHFRTNEAVGLTLALKTTLLYHNLPQNGDEDTLDELPQFVTRNLYTTVSEYSSCDSSPSEETKARHHEVRLCLTGRSHVSDGFATFDVHSLCSPDPQLDGTLGHWQQLRLRVSM